MKKEKNVLITPQAYRMLIDEYHFQPSQLLAKLPKSDVKINSPKTGRFIGVGSTTYMNLLKTYTEEELMLRRSGEIVSPETKLPIKVFGKTFNNLLTKYTLNDLLTKPRINQLTNEVPKQPIILNQQVKNKKLNEVIINNLIATKSVAVFSEAKYQDGFYYSCYFFNEGQCQNFTESVEYKGETHEFDYNYVKREANIKTIEELKQYMSDENSNELTNIKIVTIDLMSYLCYDKTFDCMKRINKKYKAFKKTNDLNHLINHHLWFESHARLLNLDKKLSINESMEDEEAINNVKTTLRKEVKKYYKMLVQHFNTTV
jgi:hypothetical protein